MNKPSIGRIVLLVVTAAQASAINGARARSDGALRGNPVSEGQTFPMVITQVWGDPDSEMLPDAHVNGQLFLDGNDTFWVTSTQASGEPTPGWYHWPKLAPTTPAGLKIEQLTAERDNWERTAQVTQTNLDFYKGIVEEIGAKFGVEARTGDDGTISEKVLALKVPELVDELFGKVAHLESLRETGEPEVDPAQDVTTDEDPGSSGDQSGPSSGSEPRPSSASSSSDTPASEG